MADFSAGVGVAKEPFRKTQIMTQANKDQANSLETVNEIYGYGLDGTTPLVRPANSETAEEAAERKSYIRSLIANGQAAVLDANGKLPRGATHEIIGYELDGTPVVKRIRFS